MSMSPHKYSCTKVCVFVLLDARMNSNIKAGPHSPTHLQQSDILPTIMLQLCPFVIFPALETIIIIIIKKTNKH